MITLKDRQGGIGRIGGKTVLSLCPTYRQNPESSHGPPDVEADR
jgi:hypothetical protein